MSEKVTSGTASINVITKEYMLALKNAKLLDNSDPGRISILTKDAGLRNGKGYSANQIRNFLYRQHTTTEAIVKLVMNFYDAKKEMRDSLAEKQKAFIEELNESHASMISETIS